MTVDTTMIENSSPFVLNSDFTSGQFTQFLAWSQDQYAGDKAATTTAAQDDQAVTLLVCHYIATLKTDVGMNSENLGGYSYSRSAPGKTGFLIRYEALLKKSGAQPSFGVARNDVNTSRAFRTTDLPIPKMDGRDGRLKNPELFK